MDTLKCYEILELPQEAPAAAIRESYVRLLQIWNPDRYEHWAMKAKAKERMVEIEEAYHHLAGFIPDLRRGPARPEADVPSSAEEKSALVDDSTTPTQWILVLFVLMLFGFAGLVAYHVRKSENIAAPAPVSLPDSPETPPAAAPDR